MTDKRILEKYVGRNGLDAPAEETPTGEDAESFGSFGYLRGVRDRAIALELRKKSGHILAVAYAFINKFEFEPTAGILLHCGGQVIKIQGRNLNTQARSTVTMFQSITRHRVPWVQEADRSEILRAEPLGVIVETITW